MSVKGEGEPWGDWGRRQLDDPGSCVRQLMALGLSQDTAFLMCLMGKIHEQLIDMEADQQSPPEDWQG